MKHIRLLVLLVLVASIVLTACGGDDGDDKETEAPTGEQPTAAVEEPTSPPPPSGELKVGLVTDVGRINDRSFNQSAWEGVQKAEEELGAEIKYIETKDAKDYEDNIRQFADEGYDVIVTVGFALGDATIKMAQEYPDIKFIGVDQFQVETMPNLVGLVFHEDQSGYLAGALAAHLSESGTIAAVLGTDLVPPVVAFKEGYEAGAKSIDPDIEIISTYHPGEISQAFTDPEWGAATAAQAIDQGADVIFGAGGMTGNGALEEAATHEGVYCIGVDTDQWLTVPGAHPCLVSSAMKLITPGVFDLIQMAQASSFEGGNYFGGAGLAPFHDFEDEIPQEVKDDLDRIYQGLQDGSISTGYGEAPPEEPTAGLTCDEPIKVGLITDLTGSLAIYGELIERSFMLGMEYATGSAGEDGVYQLDGCEIQVLVRDDQSNPETTATVARELIEVEQVDLLVGTVSSGATATLQEIARENDIVLIVAPAAANAITGANFDEHTFRVSRNNYQDAVNQCEYMTEEYDTFVQIAPDYSFGWGGAQGFRDACTYFGGEFVADDIFAPADTTDFTPYMEQILDSGAEAWIVTWAGGGFIPMMEAAADLGVLDEMALGTAFINNDLIPVFFGNAVGTTAGILYHYTAPDNPINDWLVEQIQTRYGVPPDLFDADGMNAALAVVEALKASGGNTETDALIDALEGMEFDGPKGKIYLRPEDHVAIQDMYILTLTNIDDPEFKYFEYVKTTRPQVPCLLPEDVQDRCGDLPIGSLGEMPPEPAEPTEPPEEPAAELSCDEPIKVGLITDLTGSLAIYGELIERSFMLGMEYATGSAGEDGVYQLDGCEIQVLVRDDQSNPETTATVARELIEVEQVDLLVGTVSSGATATLQEIARENDIVLIVAPAAANAITGANFDEHTFRVSRNNYQDAVNQCEYMTEEYDTFVQIAPDYSFGWGGAQGFRDACTYFGGEFVADDIFAPADTTDFTPYMEQILDSGAEAWIVTWAGGGFIPMMEAAADLGVLDEMALGTAFINNDLIPVFFGNAVGTTAGILYHYTAPDNPINDWLVEQIQTRYGVPPDLFDADGMNAALAVVEALKASGGNTETDALIDALEGMEFDGPKGKIYLRPEDHVAIQDMYILTLTNIDDPEFKYFEYVKTTRPQVPCLLPEDVQDRCGDLPIGSLTGE